MGSLFGTWAGNLEQRLRLTPHNSNGKSRTLNPYLAGVGRANEPQMLPFFSKKHQDQASGDVVKSSSNCLLDFGWVKHHHLERPENNKFWCGDVDIKLCLCASLRFCVCVFGFSCWQLTEVALPFRLLGQSRRVFSHCTCVHILYIYIYILYTYRYM